MSDANLFDVVIANCESRKIVAVVGKNLRRGGPGLNTAERRVDTAESRINDEHFAEIVQAGKFKEGDVLPKEAA